MNFLAHIYLSGDTDLIKIGNFVADAIRGKRYLEYTSLMQQGIILHREIDTYTDQHPIWRQTKKTLVPRYSHYAAVIVDMYYDHYLAKNWNQYCPISLEDYTTRFYDSLTQNYDYLPERVQRFLPIMLEENWLVQYRTIEGLAFILKKMDSRTKYISKMSFATEELVQNYEQYEEQFTLFFTELEAHVAQFIQSEKFKSILPIP